MGRRKKAIDKDDLSEDYCFVCKDGGEIRVCDFKACLKSYHPSCVKKDESFLESDERWICDWHLCYNCRKSSTFKCFCCTYSSCEVCFEDSELIKIKGTKGFCINCLRLAKLIEENVDVDSDGDMVDFADTDTYEFLFKDYWEIVKEKERLTLVNLQAADDLLKSGVKLNSLSDSDENFEEEEFEGPYVDCGDIPSKDFTRKQNTMKMVKEKFKSKKRTYVGWASKELIEFLISLGKDAQQPLGQHDVFEIIKDYIHSSKLLYHDKKRKRHVSCDVKLFSLFRRRKVNFFKVYSLLEKHFAENDDSDDESFSFEEDDYPNSAKKQRMDKFPSKQKSERGQFIEHALQPPKKFFAAITEANIKLIYLKRSLIVELMKDPKTFETKVVGCFVRRKCNPKDNYGHGPHLKMYQLDKITGVIKTPEEYKSGEMNINIDLCVSNYCKVVPLSMLSDDNFEEDECDDLRKLVKEGCFKMPSIDELKEKIRTIHEDMVKHSIKKELLKLEKLIERANEKGWRRELFDYIERKKLLNKPEEIMRLMKELPDVTVDEEAETTQGANSHVPAKNVTNLNKAEDQGDIQSLKSSVMASTKQIIFEEKTEDGVLRTSLGDATNPDLITTKEKQEDADPNSLLMDASNSDKIIAEENIQGGIQSLKSTVMTSTKQIIFEEKSEGSDGVLRTSLGDAANPDLMITKEIHEDADPNSSPMDASNSDKIIAEENIEGGIQSLKSSVMTSTKQIIFEENCEDGILRTSLGDAANPDLIITKEEHEDADPNSSLMDASNSDKIIAEENIEGHDSSDSKVNADMVVIEIDDEEEVSHKVNIIDLDAENGESLENIWNYLDPSGNVQGPFSIRSLQYWMEEGFFDEDFRIWRASQTQEDAITLGSALALLQSCDHEPSITSSEDRKQHDFIYQDNEEFSKKTEKYVSNDSSYSLSSPKVLKDKLIAEQKKLVAN